MPAETKPKPVRRVLCPECGQAFDQTHHRKAFCTPEHSTAYNNRALSRGQAMVPLAMTWRGTRSNKDPQAKQAGKDAFSQLATLADRYNEEDRTAGRPPAFKTFLRRQTLGQGTMQR